jgi:hypothetical protein
LRAESIIRRNFSLEHFQKLGLSQLPQATVDLRSKLKTERPVVQQKISEAFEQFGILCLSASPESLLMWAHYAQSHEGLVIEFDATHTFFDQRTRPGEVVNHLRQVEYEDKRPSLALSEMGDFTHIFVKSPHWEYEQEWRILSLLSEASRVVKNKGKLAHLFEFPPTIVSGVIFGCRMTNSDRTECLKTLSEVSGYENVRCLQSNVDEERFCLNFSEVNR